ncbi:hypothetical protein RHSIM_Rhsim04G0179100 [Rhododendron simsii]|uniref:RING-type domain-containing protein n=1 Tax=Rhododendron simsii TaxID=118357 RepID=A0A834LS40_RHOSS|nr:hypothetical protein RHSIM_Rhsim04G0179100 [Rhododendron simsii]
MAPSCVLNLVSLRWGKYQALPKRKTCIVSSVIVTSGMVTWRTSKLFAPKAQASSISRLVEKPMVPFGPQRHFGISLRGRCPIEWQRIDEKGRTPLILACMLSYYAAKTLIELGANVNAYCPANPLVMNDDNQTPLDVARVNWRSNVVRAIESHICLFSGWLREPFGPSFLNWVAVLPCGSRNLAKPFKLELAIYSNLQDSQPRTLVALWNANVEELKFIQSDHAVIISDIPNNAGGADETQIKLAPANDTDIQRLRHFCNACKGIPQVMHPYFPFNTQASVVPATGPSSAEDLELAIAINASIQSDMESRPPYADANPISGASTSSSFQSGRMRNHNEIQEVSPRGNPIQLIQNHNETPSSPLPSAPPIENAVVDGCASSMCVICLDALVEGACIPCGHMVGCISCLNEIKGKKWSCPVCRTKITQVIRIYTV